MYLSIFPVSMARGSSPASNTGSFLACLQGEVTGNHTSQLLNTEKHLDQTFDLTACIRSGKHSNATTSLTASCRQTRLSSANRVLNKVCRLRLLSCNSAIRALCFLSGQVKGSAHTHTHTELLLYYQTSAESNCSFVSPGAEMS